MHAAQRVKRMPAVRETRVQSLHWEDPLEKEMATHSSTLAWKIAWTGGAWQDIVHEVAKSWTQLSDFIFTFMMHAKWYFPPKFIISSYIYQLAFYYKEESPFSSFLSVLESWVIILHNSVQSFTVNIYFDTQIISDLASGSSLSFFCHVPNIL